MSGIGKLADNLRALASIPSVVASATKESVEKLIQAEFDSGNDPYGRRWQPLKKGGTSRLEETGAMRSSLNVTTNGTEVLITFTDYKVAFHQKTRPILSVGVMPPSWSKAIEEAFAKAVKQSK